MAGSAGKLSGTTPGYPHNAMYYSDTSVGGSLYLEVNANRLDAKFISETGTILDKFTMLKDVNKKTKIKLVFFITKLFEIFAM